MINYYDILAIRPDASPEEIKDAYTFQIKAVHPDKYDPATHPKQYARAVQMSERLNQARDTLLDPATRSAYDTKLAGADAPPSPPPPAPPAAPARVRRIPHPRVATAALLALIAIIALINLPTTGKTLGSTDASPTPIPCPSGSPDVIVTKVDIQPDTTAFMDYEKRDRRLYVISGIIDNQTTDTIHADELGFYLGAANSALPPDWTEILPALELSGDVSAIPSHTSVSWQAKHIVDWPVDTKGPHPANITATLTYPYTSTSKPQPQWYWSGGDTSCPMNE